MAMSNDRVHPRKRKKVCSFCVDKVTHIDFKDTVKLRRYLSERGKILPRRTTGTCAAHQRQLTVAIKRARQIALLESLPSQLDAALPAMHEKARQLARAYAQARNFFYLGRGHCYPLALEGALKLKELSYIHAEGYAAGEMKHGPIALIDPSFPTFALALDDALFPKVKSNIVEVQARQGKVIALTNPGMDLAVDDVWEIPALPAPLAGFMALPAMQLFSYEMADYLGKDVDQPRNLAKSVTVE